MAFNRFDRLVRTGKDFVAPKGKLSRRAFAGGITAAGSALLAACTGTNVRVVGEVENKPVDFHVTSGDLADPRAIATRIAQGTPVPNTAVGGLAPNAAPGDRAAALGERRTPANVEELFARVQEMAETVPGWMHPDARLIKRVKQAPYLPKTEAEVNAYGEKNGWDRAVYNRIVMLPSDHPKDHRTAWKNAVKAHGEARKWGDITAWENTWVYPMMMVAGLDDIKANNQVKVMSNGKWAEIDPVRVDNWAVSANVIDRGSPRMSVFMVPWVAGEVHARLPQDTTASEITMGFALNRHHMDVKTKGEDGNHVPAIIVRGVATAPVSILYGRPTGDKGEFELRVVETRLEPLTGNVTVHLPREGFRGDHAPFVAIRMPVVANHPRGETEVLFVPGVDVLTTDPKWAPKHRVTEEMLKAGKLVA